MSSLRARLLLLVAVVLVPSVVLLLVLVSRERTLRQEAAQASAFQLVDQGIRAQQEAVEDGLRILRAFALIESVRSGDAAACTRVVALLAGMIEEGWSVTRTRADGIQDCATRTPESMPNDVSSNPGFLKVRESGQPLIGAYIYSRGTRELLLPLNVPMTLEDGTFAGVLSAGLRLRWFESLSRAVGATEGAVVNITEGGERILVRSPATRASVPDSLAKHPISRALRAQQRGVIEAVGVDDVRRVWAFDRLPSADSAPVWLIVGLPADAVYATANAQLRVMLLALGLWLAIVLLLGWWATDRFVLQDVRLMLDATERIGRGDFSARTRVSGRSDELARLAGSVNVMAERLHERQERQAQAQKLESIGQLAGGVAHDFNNLLTAIIGNTELARSTLDAGHPARAELDEALRAAGRSAALTRQLLSFARRSELSPRVVRVDHLLRDVSSLLQRLIGEHITLDVDAAPDLPLARLDTGSVEQAILNLVVNARDAMPDGGAVVVSARLVPVQQDDLHHLRGVSVGPWIAIAVKDTGTGMTPEVLAHAFEPFFTTKPVGRGTGLGLAMVYGTVRQHDGHVWVESAPGHGTTVTLYFPPAPAGLAAEPVADEDQPVESRGSPRLLLVEDEPAVRAVVERMLRQRGFEVLTATDGADALARCDTSMLRGLDLVVSDVVMPNLGGVEMVSALRAKRPSLPVLFVSGYRETHALDALLATPHTAFLEKPFSSAALLHAVQERLFEGASATGTSTEASTEASTGA